MIGSRDAAALVGIFFPNADQAGAKSASLALQDFVHPVLSQFKHKALSGSSIKH